MSGQSEMWPRTILLQGLGDRNVGKGGVAEGSGWHERNKQSIKDSMRP